MQWPLTAEQRSWGRGWIHIEGGGGGGGGERERERWVGLGVETGGFRDQGVETGRLGLGLGVLQLGPSRANN